MNTRYTRKDAEKAFDRLMRATKKDRARSYKDVGCYELDYNATYGGCVIHKIENERGGGSLPFGLHKMTPYEFCTAVDFAIIARQL